MSDKTEPLGPSFEGFEKIPMRIAVRIGPGFCRLSALVALKPGDVISLEARVGQPMELAARGVFLGRVEPVVEGTAIAVKLIEAAEEDDANGG